MADGRPGSSCLFYGCVSFEALCKEGLLRVREGLVHTESVFAQLKLYLSLENGTLSL